MAKLKHKVVSGFLWTAGEKFGSIVVKLLMSLVLMNYLAPEEHAPIIMLGVFLAVSNVLIDSGFGQALVQRKEVTLTDYTSVFYLNIVLAALLYVILVALLGAIVWFYRENDSAPMLYTVGPWLFASGPIAALGMVQSAKLTREMRFDLLSKMHLSSNLISSVITIIMAVSGCGIWSLVAQPLTLSISRTTILWLVTSWRPQGRFSMDSIRKLFSFGSNMLYTGLISEMFGNLSQLVIPKTAGAAQLGLYDKTRKLKDEVSYTVMLALANVTFPAFASMQDEDEKLKMASRKVIAVITLVLFPVAGGLMVTGSEIFHIFVDSKWWGGITYFQLFCISAFFMPLTFITLNLIKAKGSSKTILRLEILKKTFTVAVIACTAPISVTAMVYGYLLWMAFEMVVNVVAARRFVKYSVGEIAADTLPSLGVTLIMMAAVVAVNALLPDMTLGVSLLIKIATGVAVYVAVNLLLRLPAWEDTVEVIRSLIFKKR